MGPLGKASSALGLDVDAGRDASRARADHFGFVAGHGADPVHAITAEIHERAATEFFDVAQLAGRVGQAGVEIGLDVP